MHAKIALEEPDSTKLNNTLWDSAGEAKRNSEAYMRDQSAIVNATFWYLYRAGQRLVSHT
jgi:hypothetical protein